jgi:cobalt-precorrin 5A hydrolase
MIRIVALTEAGLKLAERLQGLLENSAVWFKPKPFTENIQAAFQRGERLVLICATGIAVRTLAPVLGSKKTDPPVLVLDEAGKFVIPLLSGHQGGANNWAEQVATRLDSQTVITTANPYLNPVYSIGMGCERDCPQSYLEELLQQCLQQAGLTIDNIHSINSIAIKADEVGLIALAKAHNILFQTASTKQLRSVEHLLNSQSDYVYSVVGVYGVAESAALFFAKKAVRDTFGEEPELLLAKQKNTKATCAIARAYPTPPH